MHHTPCLFIASFRYATCGDAVIGTNVDYPDWTGSDSPGAYYLLALNEAARVSLTTCTSLTSFKTTLSIWDELPTTPNATAIARSDDTPRDGSCSSLSHDVPARGAYYIFVEGQRKADVGIFELVISCLDLPPENIQDTCSYTYMTCSDTVVGSNVGFSNFAGGASPGE